MNPPIALPCVILGAGLSGLACAITLHRAGKKVLLVEDKAQVGGRVATRRTEDGFLIDQGFQVLLNSYPELSRFVSLHPLNLKPFASGAIIFDGKQCTKLANPFRHPREIVNTLQFSAISLKDKCLVVKLLFIAAGQTSDFPMGQKSTEAFLREFGFSHTFIELFWRPFFAGVYLDESLSPGESFFLFLIRCFGLGQVSLPARGMFELPALMARELPEKSILLNTRAKSWSSREVVLESGEKIIADQVVCAFDSGQMRPDFPEPKYRSVTTHYFTGEEIKSLGWGNWLVLVPPRLGFAINHLVILTEVSSDYSRHNNPLLSVTTVGEKKTDTQSLAREVHAVAGKTFPLHWITSTKITKALPIATDSNLGLFIKDGVIYCGDRWASPSIQGALHSGRLAGETCIVNLNSR